MMPHLLPDSLKFVEIRANGVRLHVAQAGPENGPLVLLLHGFPEYWYGWRAQLAALAEAGFRVWAPDQRGYNLSEKPRPVRAYRLETLAADIAGLIEVAGVDRASVVGHDWGGAVAWQTAAAFPDRIGRLAVFNCPHPQVMRHQLLRNPRQWLRSSYILYFQLPWLPERTARIANWRPLVQAMKRSSRPGTFTEADFEDYRRAWSQPDALRSMLNWYRALMRHPPHSSDPTRIRMPALLGWGAKDQFLGTELAQPSIDFCDDGRLVIFEEATHWVLHEESGRVSDLLIHFLSDDQNAMGSKS